MKDIDQLDLFQKSLDNWNDKIDTSQERSANFDTLSGKVQDTCYFPKNPEIIDGSRRKRIAYGAGRSMQEVNQLLKQFGMMKNMMKKMNKSSKFRFPI